MLCALSAPLCVICAFLVLCLLIFLAVSWYESSKVEIPSGVANPNLPRRIHTFSTGAFILGKALDKLGVGNVTDTFNYLQKISVPKPKDDPEIFTKDLQFGGVLRVYHPRSHSAHGRKGVLFFHGSGFLLASIDFMWKLFLYEVVYERISLYILSPLETPCTLRCKRPRRSKLATIWAPPPSPLISAEDFASFLKQMIDNIRYRLAPKHKCPAALDDCVLATVHFLTMAEELGVDPSSVIICGDSAGSNLTAGVCQALVGRSNVPKPLAQVMIYPAVQMADFNLPSYQQNKMVPLLLREDALYYSLTYIGGDLSLSKEMMKGSHVPPEVRQKLSKWLSSEEFKVKGYKPHIMAPFNKDVYEKVRKVLDGPCSPLFSDDALIRQLPQAYILTCEFDVLRDDGILYKKRLEDNGVPVTWYHVKNGYHGVISFFDQPDGVAEKLAMDNVITYN
ncbi:arylacetamide deacetylase-like 4 [Phyllobates terribilis]|uniref:arylacetamide deacetylase-like 4 n=1 Tax=Phyllobates terribilis TaxID=111132 RepID=UPI003CCAE83A